MCLLFDNNVAGTFPEDELNDLKALEIKRKELLEKEEVRWRLKSKATWILEGDNNTIFFHNFINYRK
jgi:hypothetical protein